MHFWRWLSNEAIEATDIDVAARWPTVFVCPGAFDVDNPPSILQCESPEVIRFFTTIGAYELTDPATFRERICQPLSKKIEVDAFVIRKLLGLEERHVHGSEGDVRGGTPDGRGLVDIVHLSYTDANECMEDLRASHKTVHFVSSDARRFVLKVFGPVLRKYRHGYTEGLLRRLKHISLLGISYGSAFIIQVENALKDLLIALDFAETDRTAVMRSVFAVALSNVSNVITTTGPRFVAAYFEGTNDIVAREFNPHSIGKRFSHVRLDDRRILVIAPVPEFPEAWIEVIPNVDPLELTASEARHYIPFYTMRTEPRTVMPEIVERAFRNIVLRYSRPIEGLADFFRPAASLSQNAPSSGSAGERLVSNWIRTTSLAGEYPRASPPEA
jgi:hypothetical protein